MSLVSFNKKRLENCVEIESCSETQGVSDCDTSNIHCNTHCTTIKIESRSEAYGTSIALLSSTNECHTHLTVNFKWIREITMSSFGTSFVPKVLMFSSSRIKKSGDRLFLIHLDFW